MPGCNDPDRGLKHGLTRKGAHFHLVSAGEESCQPSKKKGYELQLASLQSKARSGNDAFPGRGTRSFSKGLTKALGG